MKVPAVMIGAVKSGGGKTVAACALMEALRQKGKKVAACKCGPDYIDPMFHREALGAESENLDLFFLEPDRLRAVYARHAKGNDMAVVEGVMGYYDGMSFDSERASSWEVARTLGIPVILVVSCRGMSRSVLALLKGMMEFHPDSHIRGILLNRISPAVYPRMKSMIEEELAQTGHSVSVVGYLPEDEAFCLESRHLGLVTPEEFTEYRAWAEHAGELFQRTVDMEAVQRIAEEAETIADDMEISPAGEERRFERGGTARKVRVAVARDQAFCFYYRDNLELFRSLGCELVPFSPVRDEKLPDRIGGLILGGGYPELYADRLSGNQKLLREIRRRIRGGLPCLAECGGFMYLHERMEGADGICYPMAGVIAAKAERKKRLVRFGYLTLTADRDGAFLHRGEEIRGHEFHYWDSSDNGMACTAVKPDGKTAWKCIHMEGNLFAGYPHLYLESNPAVAARFTAACRRNRDEA